MKAAIINDTVKLMLSAADKRKINDVKAMLTMIERQEGKLPDEGADIAFHIDSLTKLCGHESMKPTANLEDQNVDDKNETDKRVESPRPVERTIPDH